MLRKELSARKYQPQTIAMSGNTDCYQPAERRFHLTRSCLKVLLEFQNPVGIVTKNYLVTRDLDILAEFAKWNGVLVAVSITTLDTKVRSLMEPRTSEPKLRLKAIEELSKAGIPVMVLVAPVVPGLTDHEIPNIIQRASDAGAKGAGYVMLRLPYGVSDIFSKWLSRHFPDRKDKVLNRIRSIRGGDLNSKEFHERMKGRGIYADQVEDMFEVAKRKAGMQENMVDLSTEHFKRPGGTQLNLL